jgi:hypothetical protein
MNKQTKKILLSSVVIILIIINLSSLSTIYYHKKIRDKKIEEFKNKKEQIHIGGMHRFIKEELNLDSLQFEQFREAYYKNMRESHNIAERLNIYRYDMLSEIAKVNPNQDKLDKLSRNIGNLHYELKKLSISHFMELKGICNEEQQEDLQKLFMRMMEDQDGSRNKMRNRKGKNRKRNRNSD